MSRAAADATAATASRSGAALIADEVEKPIRRLPGGRVIDSANGPDGRVASYAAPASGPMMASSSPALSRTVRETTPWVTIPNMTSPVCGP